MNNVICLILIFLYSIPGFLPFHASLFVEQYSLSKLTINQCALEIIFFSLQQTINP